MKVSEVCYGLELLFLGNKSKILNYAKILMPTKNILYSTALTFANMILSPRMLSPKSHKSNQRLNVGNIQQFVYIPDKLNLSCSNSTNFWLEIISIDICAHIQNLNNMFPANKICHLSQTNYEADNRDSAKMQV